MLNEAMSGGVWPDGSNLGAFERWQPAEPDHWCVVLDTGTNTARCILWGPSFCWCGPLADSGIVRTQTTCGTLYRA